MPNSGKNKSPLQILIGSLSIALFVLGFSTSCTAFAQTDTTTPTTINVSDVIKTTTAKRLGLNLGTQQFWDSGMIMKNLAVRNPGFEAETWQTIMHCKVTTATSCTDDNTYTYWPVNFLAGATASFIIGPATGTTATVTSSTAATIGSVGVTMQFSGLSVAPSPGDYLVVRMNVPGNASAGWWTQTLNGATITTDTTDLSPNTPGKQALALNASGAGQQAYLNNFNDGVAGHSFINLNGTYTVSFRAKATGGSNQVSIGLWRNVFGADRIYFWQQTVNLTNSWQDYSYTFQINNDTSAPGSVALSFNAYQSSLLIDDVSFNEAPSPDNPTAYRNAVVSTLKSLHPGTLRYMDTGVNFGSTIDNLLAPQFARVRAGFTNRAAEQDDIPMSLHDFLVLCQTVGAEPWFTMPAGMTTQEMSNLMDYFGGSASTVYGAKRAALGQSAPWTTVFPTIHLEFGNEVWNTELPGATFTDGAAYGKRAGVIFTAAKASPSYSPKSFDLIIDGFQAVSYWAQNVLANSVNYDTIDTATYTFGYFGDASSTEVIYGAMFAEPEVLNDTAGGLTALEAQAAASAATPAKLAVYETNVGAIAGTATQDQVNTVLPSLGAGLSVTLNMLLAQRDLGVTVQNMFALGGFQNIYTSQSANVATTTPIFGTVVDMGGPSNLKRPMFLSEQLANTAILPSLLGTSQSGSNPTWNQGLNANDYFTLPNAHYIQSFAYTDGTQLNLVLFNLSRTSALPVNFAGLNAPLGTATVSTLTGSSPMANNDSGQENVAIKSSSVQLTAGGTFSLPPFSMTVLSVAAPTIPIQVYSVTDTCSNASLSANGSTTCSATVNGQGKYNPGVTWSAVYGSISGSGAYIAPSTLPASGKDTVTATSITDTNKTANFTVLLAPNTITGVVPSCPASSIGQGKTIVCAATVNGTGGFVGTYTWSTTGGTITPSGSLTAPVTGNSVTLTATSTQDPTKSGSVTLQLTQVLNMGPITASVTGTTATVSWTINMPANSAIQYGTTPAMAQSTTWNPSTTQTPSITLTGLQPSTLYYLQPYSFIGNQVVSTPYTFTTSNGSTAVTGVTVSCSALSLLLGASTGCAATVQGTGAYSSAVSWSTSLGTISATGVLSAPLSLTASSITVTATSVQDTTKYGTFTIVLTPVSAITGVSLACQATTITAGSTTICSPTVTSTGSISTAVTLSTSAGSITPSGVLTAPTTGTSVTVTATSVANPSKTASAVIVLSPLPTITGVSVACQASNLVAGGTTTCSSAVTGTGSYTPAVTWSTSAGTISSTGNLIAPSTGTSVTVKATSTQDPTKSGVATISLTPTLAISNPQMTVTSNSVTVSWTVNNAQAHSGVSYGPPGNTSNITGYDPNATATPSYTVGGFPAGASVELVIFSFVGNQSVSMTLYATTAAATPTVTGVSVLCSTGTLVVGSSTGCSAAVAGTGAYSSAVNWSATGGSITPGGVLTAPASGTAVTVKATSVADPTKSATATIALTQPAATISAVGLFCPVHTLPFTKSVTCLATVTGTGSYSSAVNWSVSAGAITSAGLVTAPASGKVIAITATSAQDPTKSATWNMQTVENLTILSSDFSATPTTFVVFWEMSDYGYSSVSYDSGLGSQTVTTPRPTIASPKASFTFSGLKPGTTYNVTISSFNRWKSVSQVLTITTPTN